ncbi:MAG: metallophosphoesterase [Gemmatimonadaceae bacterium]|nr:metallophosphoesterase [Gemmatimonadaceae bacterium]
MLVVALIIVVTLAAGAMVWHALLVAPGDVQLTKHEVPIPGLPPAFDGYRIAVLADFHHGPQQPAHRARRAVALANAQSPHIAVLLGDYGTSEWAARDLSLRWYHRTFEVLGPILRTLRAPDGVLAVIGNHDYYASGDETHDWLESLGVRALRNAAIDVPSPDGPVRFVGLDDLEEGIVDADIVADLVRGDSPTIVLSHHPDGVRFCRHPSVRLVLSGHTHGGQVVLPWLGAPITRSEVCTRLQPAGWVANPYAPLFVSRGIGSQIPVRVGSTPEVVILTLRTLEHEPSGTD